MKYTIRTEETIEDKTVLTGEVSYYSIAKKIGKTSSYITMIANEKRLPPEKTYLEIKEAEIELKRAKQEKLDNSKQTS